MALRDTFLPEALRERGRYYTERIEEELHKELNRYRNSRFYEPLTYALEGGKRVRPLILLNAADAVGGPREDPYPAVVAVELLHTESIIHDDIIDQTLLRRERKAFHVKYGYSVSLLTADFVFGMILDIASRYHDSRIGVELSQAALKMCEGEMRELLVDPLNDRLGWDEYVEILALKTASLFQASARLGGLLGHASTRELEALAAYGLNLGIAYQIHDDILDWGEPGKVTQALDLGKSQEETLQHLKEHARAYATRATRELEALKESPARDFLKHLANFTVERTF